jgi:hypothetical protein
MLLRGVRVAQRHDRIDRPVLDGVKRSRSHSRYRRLDGATGLKADDLAHLTGRARLVEATRSLRGTLDG